LSSRLRFGIIGLGRAATATVPALARRPDAFEVMAAADTNPAALAAFQQRFPSARAYADAESLAADGQVEAVYIATPTHLHTQHVLLAAAAGKHVIVEKPLATSLADADRMIEAVERAGVHLIVGHSQSYEPPIRAMREVLREGRIGRLRLISGWYFNDWLYRPRLPSELDTAQGGGVVFRQGAHHFDIARLLGGGLVRSVRATAGMWDTARPTEGSYAALLQFDNGAVASLVYNGYDHFHTTELTGVDEGGAPVEAEAREHAAARKALLAADDASLKGQRGFAGAGRSAGGPRLASHFGLLIISCDHGDMRQMPGGLRVYGDTQRWDVPLPEDLVGRDLMVAELYDAVVRGIRPLHDARWAKATLEVSLAVLESSRTQQEVLLRHQVPTPD
jgi:phthalate 4,5-cis-dihydrodiol dehydrogenase